MAASVGTARHWQEVTGCAMVEGWGMSETCGIGRNIPITSKERSGTIGLPLPSIEIAIKDDDGKSLAIGESGEICIKGPQVVVATTTSPKTMKKNFYG